MNTQKMREIDITDNSGIIDFEPRRLRNFIRALDLRLPARLKAPKGILSIAFFDDAELCDIHVKFLNDPKKTDVITFAGDEEMAGEICISAERALDWSAKYANRPDRELALYVAHGYLHLAGLNDIEPEDAAQMRLAEAEALKIFDSTFRKPLFVFHNKNK